jgi:hypothetical protein
LPDERALTWLVLSLEKLGEVGGVEPAAVPVTAAVRDIATPAAPARVHNRAVCMLCLPLRGLRDVPLWAIMFRTLAVVIVEHNGFHPGITDHFVTTRARLKTFSLQ